MRLRSNRYVCHAASIGLALLNIGTSFAAPTAPEPALVIDSFRTPGSNDLGAWHGADEGMPIAYGAGYIELSPSDADMNFNTQVSLTCRDMTPYEDMFLHIVFTGTDQFTISFSQNNDECDPSRAPYPMTWDSVEASRYAKEQDIYIPISHFNIDLTKATSIAFNGFYTKEEIQLYKVEITYGVPDDFYVPEKLASGTMVLKCKRPNSFAFGIDDGQPKFAQEVMDIIAEEDIKVTFFTVGNGLLDDYSNFTGVYQEMLRRGHQVALHSFSHPKMENLESIDEIDREFTENMRVFEEKLGVQSRYFRPPYGVIGARTRQRLAALIDEPYIINWSVDIEDWLWADSPTPEKQLEAFQRALDKGGDLAVMHFLSPTTVSYFREVFQMVKRSGRRIMRVDQCMEDPEAPPLDDDEDYDWDDDEDYDDDYY